MWQQEAGEHIGSLQEHCQQNQIEAAAKSS